MEHMECLQRGSAEGSNNRVDHEEGVISAINNQDNPLAKRCLERAAMDGAWIRVLPSIINGTNFSDDEFWDNVRLHFGLDLQGPHK